MKLNLHTLKVALIFSCCYALLACGAISTSVKKHTLDVQTKASESIFLEPVSPDKRTIFVSVRNTSDKDLNIKSRILGRLVESGYTIVDDPDAAQFMLQTNVLKVGKDDLKNSESYLEAGFSGAVLGGAIGSKKGAVLGAIAGIVADSLIDDTLYTMVTDLQVRERRFIGSWKTYRTRIVSTANRSNLEFAEALPALEGGLVRSIAGMFAE